MAEDEVQDQETGTPEPSDEDVWESVEEEDSDETTVKNEAEQETEEQAEPVAEDSEEAESDAEEETSEEEPKHNYEQRYKSLEKEFHKRNQAAKEMKAQYDEMRLQMVERDQQLQQLKQQVDQVTQEPDEPAPSDPEVLDNFFTDEDKETMEEFGELTKTFRKVVQHELAKANQAPQENDMASRVEQLEGAAKQYMYEKFLADHEKAMVRDVGKFYTQLDRDPDFQKFVLDSPALTQMMTKSTEAKDHAAVMNLYLDKTGTRAQWEPTKASKKDPTPKQQQRRVAATGAVKNTAPRMEKSTENMSDEELWNSIEEQEAEF